MPFLLDVLGLNSPQWEGTQDGKINHMAISKTITEWKFRGKKCSMRDHFH